MVVPGTVVAGTVVPEGVVPGTVVVSANSVHTKVYINITSTMASVYDA